MGNQRTFASLAWQGKGKVTRRERFLAEMDAVIPWARLIALIKPHYPKAGQGRQPLGLEKMLRIYFLQQWFNLSDPQAEDAIYDSESMRRFARVELGEEVVPDESTILRFRHLLEQHGLTQAILGMYERIDTCRQGRPGKPSVNAGKDRRAARCRNGDSVVGDGRAGASSEPACEWQRTWRESNGLVERAKPADGHSGEHRSRRGGPI